MNIHREDDRPPSPPQHPPPNCPRCHSFNTKFCYYNNYSLSQPRYFCKTCRRYWTHGGTLRNIPVGGSARKRKQSDFSSSSSSSSSSPSAAEAPVRSVQPTSPANYFPGDGFLSSLAAMNMTSSSSSSSPPSPQIQYPYLAQNQFYQRLTYGPETVNMETMFINQQQQPSMVSSPPYQFLSFENPNFLNLNNDDDDNGGTTSTSSIPSQWPNLSDYGPGPDN